MLHQKQHAPTNGPSTSLAAAGGVLIEVNTTPGLHHHDVPGSDPAAVAVRVLEKLLERGRPGTGRSVSPEAPAPTLDPGGA